MSQHSQASIEPYIDNPNPYDVYLGRGNAVAQNSGNRIYRSTIKQYKVRYFEAKGHQGKGQIAKTVVKSFIEMGATFYYKKDTVWEKAPIDIVLKKVKQALREKGLKTTRAPRPSRISSRGQISRRGTTSRSFPATPSTSLGSKPQVGEKVLITRLDGSVVDAVSVCSSFAPTSVAPTSQQLSEDRYPIDSGHWRRLRFQSKNKYTESMVDRLSAVSFSTTMTAESFKPPSTMQSSGDIHTFRSMDQQSTHMSQTMAVGQKSPEMGQQQPAYLSEGLGFVQDQVLSNQNENAKSLSNHDITGQGQASDCPLPILSKDSQQLECKTNNSSAIPPSNFNHQVLPQEQFNLSIPVCKGENVQVDLSYLNAETNSLHSSNMNFSNIQNPLMEEERIGSIMDDDLSSDLSYVDVFKYMDHATNYPENVCMCDNVNLEDIFEEPSGATNNSGKSLNNQKEQRSKTSIGDKFSSLAI